VAACNRCQIAAAEHACSQHRHMHKRAVPRMRMLYSSCRHASVLMQECTQHAHHLTSLHAPLHGAGAADVDLLTLTLVDVLAGLDNGTFTSESLTLAYLEAIAKFEDTLNAFTFLSARALDVARASDARRAGGGHVGAMEGVPVVIKEAINVEGFPSTLGWSRTYGPDGGVSLFPVKNAAVVQILLDAGAVIIGKTNMPAFLLSTTNANTSWAGPTFNAVNRQLAPGGSSSGTATATAAGFAVWGMADETGGSIQVCAPLVCC
jgi:amidase